ncbi:hypothetical protein ACJX0J_031948, partial [Zea mays]
MNVSKEDFAHFLSFHYAWHKHISLPSKRILHGSKWFDGQKYILLFLHQGESCLNLFKIVIEVFELLAFIASDLLKQKIWYIRYTFDAKKSDHSTMQNPSHVHLHN